MGEPMTSNDIQKVTTCADSLRNFGLLFAFLGILLFVIPLSDSPRRWDSRWVAITLTLFTFGLMYIAASVLVRRQTLWAIDAVVVLTCVVIFGTVAVVVWLQFTGTRRETYEWFCMAGVGWMLLTEYRSLRAAKKAIQDSTLPHRGFDVLVNPQTSPPEPIHRDTTKIK